MGLDIFKAHTNFPGMICKLKKRSRKTIIQAPLDIRKKVHNSNRILHRNHSRGVKMHRQGELSYPARFTVVGIPNPARKGGNKLMIKKCGIPSEAMRLPSPILWSHYIGTVANGRQPETGPTLKKCHGGGWFWAQKPMQVKGSSDFCGHMQLAASAYFYSHQVHPQDPPSTLRNAQWGLFERNGTCSPLTAVGLNKSTQA